MVEQKTKAKNLSLTRSFIKALLMEYKHDHSTAESSHARRYLQSCENSISDSAPGARAD